jgi:Fe-Mn family superoxide dismutase
MKLHHDKHHAGYTAKLNSAIENDASVNKKSIEEILSSLDDLDEAIRKAVTNNGGGFYNHSVFWEIMATKKDQEPDGELLAALNKSFSSFEKFKELFTEVAGNHFGSGWAWLVLSKGKLEIIDTNNQDSPISLGKNPILTLDVWEHAYYLKYQNRRPEYIEAWWHVVNWTEVQKRFEKST